MQEIRCENIFIDGIKIEANANKYTFVWKKAIDKFGNKLQDKIKEALESLANDLEIKLNKVNCKITVKYIKELMFKLKDSKEKNN